MPIEAQTGIFSYHRAGKFPCLIDIDLECVIEAVYRVGGWNKETECPGRLNPLALGETESNKEERGKWDPKTPRGVYSLPNIMTSRLSHIWPCMSPRVKPTNPQSYSFEKHQECVTRKAYSLTFAGCKKWFLVH